MPLAINDVFDLPYSSPTIRVALEPARVAIQSLLMLTRKHTNTNIAEWVIDTHLAMSQEERDTNNLVMLGLHYVVLPTETWASFPTYIDHLASMNPDDLRDKMISFYENLPCIVNPTGEMIDYQKAMTSPEYYLSYLRQRYASDNVDEKIERKAYRYVIDPPALQQLVVNHLHHMWDRYLSKEWERVKPTLQSIVQAYRKVDLKGNSFLEAARLITGQDLDAEKWAQTFSDARRVIFVPHPHVGPYIPKSHLINQEVIVFFSPQLPDWTAKEAPDLKRAEISFRLNILADDTRLQILRYIAENGEQPSHVIMKVLHLSQSAASRHLTQLSAGGFVSERRCDGAKCYSLNPERVTDTLQAIARFLSVQERIGL